MDSLLAEAAGVPQDALHHDVDAICRAYNAVAPIAERLGVETPQPGLAGFAYCHVSTLGAQVHFADGSEPNVRPIIKEPADIDRLREPTNYLFAGVVPDRLETLHRLSERRSDVRNSIGHTYEGPVTTAALLMGPDFFMLPYEDPTRAHRLLAFCVESALNYADAIRMYLGVSVGPQPISIPDDFAGIFPPALFPEFVVPYWEQMYEGMQATERRLHSELLRQEHLPFLADLNIAVFDPSADQYLTTELLHEKCPTPFTARILSWRVRDYSEKQLQAMYRHLANFKPVTINFHMGFLEEEPKIQALLRVARELAR